MRTIVAGVSTLQQYEHIRKILYSSLYGKIRRQQIINILHAIEDNRLAVNGNHLIQTKQDPDIQWLLKHNKIKLVRKGVGVFLTKSNWNANKKQGKRQTYIQLR